MKTKNENNIVLESLIFPSKQLPKCFSNYNLYKHLGEIGDSYTNVEEMLEDNFVIKSGKIKEFKGNVDSFYGLKKGTEPINLFISKPNGGNRILSIVNPLVLLPLHFYINKNNNEILLEQNEDSTNFASSSKFSFERGEFVRDFDYDGDPIMGDYEYIVQHSYQYNLLKKQKICDGKYYHLSVDINNFYSSIYTHIISWNLKHIENKVVFDNLDFLNRTLNCNETKGIVIGPYTSNLFAEIILSKVDRKLVPACVKEDISYVRYCDDYDFYSDSKEKLENNVRLLISEQLSKYKLDLNMSKMKLDEFPFISLDTLQNKNIFLILKRIIEKDYKNSLEFIEDIMNVINDSIKIKYSNCNYVLKILTSQIAGNRELIQDIIDSDTAEILLDFLINMMFKQNMISKETVNLILEIFELKNLNLEKDRIITKWIRKRNDRLSHIKEITDIWLIYLIIKLEICNKECENFAISVMYKSDLCALLSFEFLYKNNLIKKYKEKIKEYLDFIKNELENRFLDNWKSASYYTKYWLLFYTNSIRWKIHSMSGFKDTILKDVDLKILLEDSNVLKRLNLFKIIMDLNIEFLTFD